jgi:hypothetical protein
MSFVCRLGSLCGSARGVLAGSISSGSAMAGPSSPQRQLHSLRRSPCCCSARRPATSSRASLTPNVRLACISTSARRSSQQAWMGAAASTLPTLSQSIESNTLLAATMRAMHVIAPLSLADSSWDNVGLLVGASDLSSVRCATR